MLGSVTGLNAVVTTPIDPCRALKAERATCVAEDESGVSE